MDPTVAESPNNKPYREAIAEPGASIDLLELFYMLLDHWLIILLCMVLGGLAAFGYTKYWVTPLYKATSKLYVISASNDSIVNLSDLSLGQSLAGDYSAILVSRPFLERVIDNNELNEVPSSLAGKISVTNPSGTRMLAITVTSDNPEQCSTIANAVAEEAVSYLPKVMGSTPPNFFEYAVTPTFPSSPSYSRNIMMGALIGGALACAFYVLRFLMNDTISSPEEIMEHFGDMPLGTIPEHTKTPGKRKKKGE